MKGTFFLALSLLLCSCSFPGMLGSPLPESLVGSFESSNQTPSGSSPLSRTHEELTTKHPRDTHYFLTKPTRDLEKQVLAPYLSHIDTETNIGYQNEYLRYWVSEPTSEYILFLDARAASEASWIIQGAVYGKIEENGNKPSSLSGVTGIFQLRKDGCLVNIVARGSCEGPRSLHYNKTSDTISYQFENAYTGETHSASAGRGQTRPPFIDDIYRRSDDMAKWYHQLLLDPDRFILKTANE